MASPDTVRGHRGEAVTFQNATEDAATVEFLDGSPFVSGKTTLPLPPRPARVTEELKAPEQPPEEFAYVVKCPKKKLRKGTARPIIIILK